MSGPAVSPRGTQIPGLTHHAPRRCVVGPPVWGFLAVERLVRIPSYAAFLNFGFSHLRPKFQVTQIHYKKPALALYSTRLEAILETGIQRENYGTQLLNIRYRGKTRAKKQKGDVLEVKEAQLIGGKKQKGDVFEVDAPDAQEEGKGKTKKLIA